MVARRMRKARKPRRRVAKRRGGRKAGLAPSKQYATIVETLQSNPVLSDQPYQCVFNLAQFFRATTVAKNFQYYRAKTVKWEYMPLYNTFQENNSVQAVGKPQMYFMMNRDQDIKFSSLTPASALFSIQSAGADPVAFVKNREIIYKPNWCSPGLQAYQLQTIGGVNAQINTLSLGMKKQFGWLPTPNVDAWSNPALGNQPLNPLQGVLADSTVAPNLAGAVVYNGHNLYIQQTNDPEGVVVGNVICTVEWEFKGGKELYSTITDPAPPAPVESAK